MFVYYWLCSSGQNQVNKISGWITGCRPAVVQEGARCSGDPSASVVVAVCFIQREHFLTITDLITPCFWRVSKSSLKGFLNITHFLSAPTGKYFRSHPVLCVCDFFFNNWKTLNQESESSEEFERERASLEVMMDLCVSWVHWGLSEKLLELHLRHRGWKRKWGWKVAVFLMHH